MNWTALFGLVKTALNSLKQTTAPAPTTATIEAAPSDAVKALQHLINTYAAPTPHLAEDGHLGPKTEAAVLNAVAMLGPLLSAYFGK